MFSEYDSFARLLDNKNKFNNNSNSCCSRIVFLLLISVCFVYLTVEPPPRNDVKPLAPSSSSSHAPPPSSSKYRERRSRRTHRGGGTRDDRYRSGQNSSIIKTRTSEEKCIQLHFPRIYNTSDEAVTEEIKFSLMLKLTYIIFTCWMSLFLKLRHTGLFQRDQLKARERDESVCAHVCVNVFLLLCGQISIWLHHCEDVWTSPHPVKALFEA